MRRTRRSTFTLSQSMYALTPCAHHVRVYVAELSRGHSEIYDVQELLRRVERW